MKVTSRSRRQIRLQNILFVILFLVVVGLLAWLSTLYTYQADWTANGRNTLSQASVAILKELNGPVTVTAFVREESSLLRKRIAELSARYQRYKHDMTLEFVDPDVEPQRVRELGISSEGELIIKYRERTEQIEDMSENGLTNALQRLVRGDDRTIAFLEGHGERNYKGDANYDLSSWVRQLTAKGIKARGLNLGVSAAIPDDISLLVIAGPQAEFLPGEVTLLRQYVTDGGNLLWLADPGELHGLAPLADELGIRILPGVVIDPNIAQVGMMLFGTDDPRVTLVASYGEHPIVKGFQLNTLFPLAAGIEARDTEDWDHEAFLQTLSNTWSETTQTSGQITFDPASDITGPLTIGVALTRKNDKTNDERPGQRIVVMGDGDFLSNAFLGGGGNLQLAMNIINWLLQDDQLIAIPAKTARDLSLELSEVEIATIGFGFLAVLPLGLLGSGFLIWYRRRKR